MPDNVTTQSSTLASVPSGGVYAADLISSVYFFRQKLALGADGAWTADAAGRDTGSGDGAMYVDPRPKSTRIAVTPTVSTTPAYTAKDAVGGLMTFSNAVRASGGSGLLYAVQVVDKGQQMKDLDLVLFDRSITAPTDNSIFNPSDTELTEAVGTVRISSGDYADFNNNSVATVANVGIEFVLNGTDLFGVLVARGTPTYTSTTDIVVTLTILQD